MSDALQTAWNCPSCGRHIPRGVEVCRCGSERRRLEALGYAFQTTPAEAPRERRAPRHSADETLAGRLIGYRIDSDVSAAGRAVLKTFIAAATITAGAFTLRAAYGDPLPVRNSVDVLSTLDDFTRKAGPESGNTIPAFLAAPGRLGALAPAGRDDDPVRTLDEAELRQGFCSENVAKHIRYEFPGYYDQWSDARLARVALEKHPEYATRFCSLSHRLDAGSNEIVKYVYKPRTILGHAWAWAQGLLVAAAAAFLLLNGYYRGIVGAR